MEKKVLIVAHFCDYGEEQSNNRFNYIADMLSDLGCRVTVVTSSFCHRNKTQREHNLVTSPKYNVDLVAEPSYKKNVSVKRLFYSHKVFAKNLKKYLEQCNKPDIVYVAVPSNDAASVAAEYCKKNNIPLIADIQDLWPEAFRLVLNVPVVSDILFNPMEKKANKIYEQADKIAAVSKTYANRGTRNCIKDKDGTVVFLGTDLETFDSSAEEFNIEKDENELWITYVGTLGHSYNIEIIIDALRLLPKDLTDNIVFKVLGDGPLLERFKEHARGSGVNVEFLGRRNYSEMVAYLKKSDIAVNPISKGAAQSIINKHGDYAMAGLPVVSTQESEEYRALLEDYGCGINCSADSSAEVAQAIKKLAENEDLRRRMGENSRRLGEEKFDRKQSYKAIAEIIENL